VRWREEKTAAAPPWKTHRVSHFPSLTTAAGTVHDVPGDFVKDVVGLDTGNHKSQCTLLRSPTLAWQEWERTLFRGMAQAVSPGRLHVTDSCRVTATAKRRQKENGESRTLLN
jgi:hypothetical protein